ncbi:MAG TPA: hypothetical protein VFL99_01870 [Segeticoccus sp.]|uniref:hypothetical protein n=1 Tax=Segeticoccus sp. TaxID=2706531 RepID=UPI002D7F5B76|nr:hypothetical protein [Segeticoccus sp.]HET8599043.1 hypothetical protein [Segeticoccus sp.]
MGTLLTWLAALFPTAGILYLFWLVMKNLVEADRRERLAHSRWEAEHGIDDNTRTVPPRRPH